MLHQKIGARAGDTAPTNSTTAAANSLSKKAAENQSRTIPPLPDPHTGVSIKDWSDGLVKAGLFSSVQVVDGDGLGPIATIGSPRVCVGFRDDCTVVWCERVPWGFGDPYRLFLNPGSKAARRYAISVAERIRDAAVAEQAKRDRIREAKMRERFGFLGGEAAR